MITKSIKYKIKKRVRPVSQRRHISFSQSIVCSSVVKTNYTKTPWKTEFFNFIFMLFNNI